VGAIKGDQARFAELADSVQSLLQELVSLAAFYHGVRRGCGKGAGVHQLYRRVGYTSTVRAILRQPRAAVVITCCPHYRSPLSCMIWNDGWVCSSCPRTPSWDPRCSVAGGR
jgi:hypothetical protein